MAEYLIPLARDKDLAYAVYVPQIEARERIDEWLGLARDDEFLHRPSTNWCAICCNAMILRFVSHRSPSLEELYQDAFQYHVYSFVRDRVVGAVHVPLAHWMGVREGRLFAKAVRDQTWKDIERWLRSGCFVMASVAPQIRSHGAPPPSIKGGHFVLLYGWYTDEDEEGGVILHDSAGLYKKNTQVHVRTPWSWFCSCFSGNAVVVHVLDPF